MRPFSHTIVPSTIEAYKRLLACHDWGFEYSDDHSVWKRGIAEQSAIRIAQEILDPDRTIYNQFARK